MTCQVHRGLIGLTALALCACSTVGVKPWQREVLSRPSMQLNASPLDTAVDNHLYFSREASSGGSSFAGGGCGCN